MFEIIFYETELGRCPIVEFLETLDSKLLAKTLRTIDLLEEFGNKLRVPYTKALEDGILELRTIHGTNITRILFFYDRGNKIVLTHGFVKKSQGTPRSEIELAKKYRNDYLRRADNEEI